MDQQEQLYQWELLVVTEKLHNGNTKIVMCWPGATIQQSAVYQSKMLARTEESVMIVTEAI